MKNFLYSPKSKKIIIAFCVLFVVSGLLFPALIFMDKGESKSGYEIIKEYNSDMYASGSVYFYAKKTNENDIPQIKNFAKMENVQQFLELLKQQTWVDDSLVDRTEFKFDGKVFYDGWIYFGYDSVIFYNGYFCNTNEKIDAILKECQENSKLYYEQVYGELGDGTLTFEYKSLSEPLGLRIVLSPQDNSYQFIYSHLSSFAPSGVYELTEKNLILKNDDGDFVFNVVRSGFEFDAEKSAKIPEYKYDGNSAEKTSPVPDKAVFKLREP